MPCGKVLRLCKKISFSGQLQFYPNPGHTMTMIDVYKRQIQRDDTGEVQAVELVVRGRHKEVDSGEWKTGERCV